MRSRCFIGFLISVLGEPNIYQNLGRFTRNGKVVELCLTVKNYWGLLTGDDGVDGGDFT
jgi:hypothetical protein|tara:strand:- start:737 stop:913 length:177 start_codon:yes stop_codon:yes gene_type:complete